MSSCHNTNLKFSFNAYFGLNRFWICIRIRMAVLDGWKILSADFWEILSSYFSLFHSYTSKNVYGLCVCKCFCLYPSDTLCDFESECLWTPSNHSQHGDWKVTSPSQVGSEQAGAKPATDHSVGSSKGKREKTHWGEWNRMSLKSKERNPFDLKTCLNCCPNNLPEHLFWCFVYWQRHTSRFCDIPQPFSWSDFMTRPSWLCQSLCFHSDLSPSGHFLLLSFSPAAEDSGMCGYHLTSPVLPGSDEYCIFQVALFEAGPVVGNLTLMIQPERAGSARRSVVLNRRNHDDRRSANRPFLSLWRSLWGAVIYFLGMPVAQQTQQLN